MQLSALELFQHDAGYLTGEQEGWDRLLTRMLRICDESGPGIPAWTLRVADASTLGTFAPCAVTDPHVKRARSRRTADLR